MLASYIDLAPQHQIVFVETSSTSINLPTSDLIEVRQEQKGKFLALVPITFEIKVIVEPNTQVKIEYPWYSVLTIDHQSEVETKIKAAVNNALGRESLGIVRGEGEAREPTFTLEQKQAVERVIEAVLQEAFDQSG